MKRIAIACTLALSGHAFASSTAAQLVQACQSLKRQDDRNTCLAEAVKAVSGSAQQAAAPVVSQVSAKDAAQARAQKALDASQAIQSVAASGTSLLQYTPYVQQFSIALDQFRAAAQTPEEKDAVALLAEALQAYSDVGTYWEADINFYSHGDYRSTYPGAQPTGLTGTRYILDRYDVPISKADFWGLQKGAPLSTAASVIWEYARDKTSAAKDAIANVGIPARVDEKAAASKQHKPKADPSAELREMIGKPLVWHVKDTFEGGAYADHDLTAPRDTEPAAGRPVPVYASYGAGWFRTTPLGVPPHWFRSADLLPATDIR